MSTPDPEHKPHSADYFGEQRDFWWNADFVALMARRWQLADVHMALDVGAGVGHWGRLLLPHLAPGARLFGIDREEAWVREAHERASRAGVADRTSYRLGEAERIPFHDGVFDLVTCQTLLMHVRDPRAVLREMMRVLKPGGLLAVAEPNNLAGMLMLGSSRWHEDVELSVAMFRLGIVCHRGKESLGEGNNSIGELMPGYLAEVGLTDIQSYQSDKAGALFPPYATREQQVQRAAMLDFFEREFFFWDQRETRRYFLAGGGSEADFQALWEQARQAGRATDAGLRAGTEHRAGGGLFYLVSGRKPG